MWTLKATSCLALLLWLKLVAAIPTLCPDQQRVGLVDCCGPCCSWPCPTRRPTTPRPPPTPSPYEQLLKRIKNLEAKAANNEQEIENMEGRHLAKMSSNTKQIKSNTGKITSNTGKVTSNTGKITSNSGKITSNTGKITSNTGKITGNSDKIASNTKKIRSNSHTISSNTGKITSNTGKIASNTGKITDNTGKITSNTGKVTDNTGKISSNTDKITSNSVNIASNFGKIDLNTGTINDNTALINNNNDKIEINTGKITNNTGKIIDNTNQINNNTFLIRSPECVSYSILDDSTRRATNSILRPGKKYADHRKPCWKSWKTASDWKGEGWYRISGAAGNKITETDPGDKHCGTNDSGYIDSSSGDGHPTTAGMTVDAKVCYHEKRNACSESNWIKITFCGEFYVYYLREGGCDNRYCTE